MEVEKNVVLGWAWFGIGKIRIHAQPSRWYTIWMLLLTRKFAIGSDEQKPTGKEVARRGSTAIVRNCEQMFFPQQVFDFTSKQ